MALKAGEVLEAAFPDRMKSAGNEALVRAGRLGRKSGRGFYDYDGGKRRRPAREAYEALGVEPRDAPPIDPEGIVSRLTLPMINEAAYCLGERVVATPGKLDLAMILGTGFPPFRGGLLRYADSLGARRIQQRLEEFVERLGPRFAPAPLLVDLARSGGEFYAAAGQEEKTA